MPSAWNTSSLRRHRNSSYSHARTYGNPIITEHLAGREGRWAAARARPPASLPDAANLCRAISVDHALGVHLDALPAGLEPLPGLPVVPVDLGSVLQVGQLPGLHPRGQV